jgi:hypothetical protein
MQSLYGRGFVGGPEGLALKGCCENVLPVERSNSPGGEHRLLQFSGNGRRDGLKLQHDVVIDIETGCAHGADGIATEKARVLR